MNKNVTLGLSILGFGGCLLALAVDSARREKVISTQIEEFLKAMKVI